MSQIELYFDEDAMHSRLVSALRFRGVRVITVLDAGLTEKTDEDQLAFAPARGVSSIRSMSPISIGFTRNGSAPAESMLV